MKRQGLGPEHTQRARLNQTVAGGRFQDSALSTAFDRDGTVDDEVVTQDYEPMDNLRER